MQHEIPDEEVIKRVMSRLDPALRSLLVTIIDRQVQQALNQLKSADERTFRHAQGRLAEAEFWQSKTTSIPRNPF